MSSIDSSAYYSVGSKASSSQGLSGLMSGMDTEAMVEKMLSGTQGKIDKQEALKQQTQWKQDIYRDVISTINGFYNKFFNPRFDASVQNNFANNAFFNSMLSQVESGNALKILSTNSSALSGDMRVAVKQLASSAKLTSTQKVSGEQKILGSALDDAALTKQFNKEITLKIDDTSTIKVNLNHVTTEQELVDTFEQAFDAAGKTGIKAEIFSGKLRFVTDNPATKITVDKESTSLGLQMTGLASVKSTTISNNGTPTGSLFEGSNTNLDAGYRFDLSLDGVQKTITLNKVNGSVVGDKMVITANDVKTALQEEVKKTFGDYVTVDLNAQNQFEFSLNMKDAGGNPELGHELTITGSDAAKIGITPGSSTHINTNTSLKSLGLSGDRFSFTINGVSFSFTGEDTVGRMLNTINSSSAGVRMTYSSLSDTFQMEATSMGSKYGIELSQQEGNVLGVLFGNDKVSAGGSVASNKLTVGTITGNAGGLEDTYTTEGASFSMNVNGKNYTFTLSKKEGKTYHKDEIETQLNQWMKNTFGTDDKGDANISYENGAIKTADGFIVSFDASTVDPYNPANVAEAQKNDLAYALGFNQTANSNLASENTPISEIQQLKGIDLSTIRKSDGSQALTLKEIATIDGHNITYSDGRLALSGSGTVDLSGSPELAALFGGSSFSFGDGQMATGAVTQGQDAKVMINGVETTRSSNNFTVDGISMQLTNVSQEKKDAGGNVIGYEETVITTDRNVDSIVDSFQSFVDEYNAMIEKLNGYIGESPDYRQYPPLTDAQKKEMSEQEIKLWEEKSKKGLIRNDDTVSQFLSQMRSILYQKPAGSSVALYQIGIETTPEYNDKGKLQLNKDALRNALATDPDSVRNLFTDTTDGLSKQLMAAMDNVAKQSSSTPGTLIQLAGVKGSSSEKNNMLYDRITGLENRIKDLKTKYEKERQRYWNQFNSMEKIMADFNSQSMMISQQFGGY